MITGTLIFISNFKMNGDNTYYLYFQMCSLKNKGKKIWIYSFNTSKQFPVGWSQIRSPQQLAVIIKNCIYNLIPWSREWQPTPMFLPGKFHLQKSLVGHSPWDCKETDMAEWLSTHTYKHTFIIHRDYCGSSTQIINEQALGNICFPFSFDDIIIQNPTLHVPLKVSKVL